MIFLLLTIAIGTTGYLTYIYQKNSLQQQTQTDLVTIADAKVTEISHWLVERRNDARMIAYDPFLAEQVRQWLATGASVDEERGQRLLAWLTDIKNSFDYAAVMLIDQRGQVRLGIGANQIHPKRQALVLQAIKTQQILLTDLHCRQESASGTIDIDLIAPLGIDSGSDRQQTAALLFKIDPERYLFPLIQHWPTPSASGETLLVRREGGDVVYLNELRHRKNTALSFRVPIKNSQLPAAMAVNGERRIVEARDYRQIEVMAALREVPGTSWLLVAKIDADEVYAPVRALMLLVASVVGVFIAGAGLGTAQWWRQQQTVFMAEQYRSELERQALIQHFDYLSRYANDIILLMNAQGGIIEANARAVSAYGYAHEELMGLNLADLADPGTPMPTEDCLNQVASRDGFLFESMHRRKDGSRFPVEVSARLIEIDGKIFLHGIIRDITERKRLEEGLRESEARLRALATAVPDVLVMVDEEGRYVEVFTPQPDLLYTDPAALKGKMMSEILPPDLTQRFLTTIKKTLLTRQPQVVEYELSIAKAGKRYFETRTAPVEAPGLNKPAVVALARDITRRKHTEDHLRQAQKMQAIGQLTGGVAHDFNNLLAIMMANLELLEERLADEPELRDLLRRTFDALDRGANLTQRLLAFSRKQPLQPKSTDLNALVEGIIDLLQRTLGETIKVRSSLADDLALTIVDPSQLESALLNLALNARDAMPNGGTLTIETANRWLDEDYARLQLYYVRTGQYVMLAASDTGTGMSPEVMEHAFEPFFTTKEVGKGSGLGLSMVYGLVKQSGGYINIYSEPDQGTTVKMYLPKAQSDEAASEQDDRTNSYVLRQGKGELILVVEDDNHVRQLAVGMLLGLGYRTIEAEDAATALKLLSETPQIALLFTDVVLPGGVSGTDLANEARRCYPYLKVLFTSGYSDRMLHSGIPATDATAFLAKPYRRITLAKMLHSLLNNPAQSAMNGYG